MTFLQPARLRQRTPGIWRLLSYGGLTLESGFKELRPTWTQQNVPALITRPSPQPRPGSHCKIHHWNYTKLNRKHCIFISLRKGWKKVKKKWNLVHLRLHIPKMKIENMYIYKTIRGKSGGMQRGHWFTNPPKMDSGLWKMTSSLQCLKVRSLLHAEQNVSSIPWKSGLWY